MQRIDLGIWLVLTNNLDVHISPMKLLVCAIRTASLTDVELRPLLSVTPQLILATSRLAPRSLQRSTGSKIPSGKMVPL